MAELGQSHPPQASPRYTATQSVATLHDVESPFEEITVEPQDIASTSTHQHIRFMAASQCEALATVKWLKSAGLGCTAGTDFRGFATGL